MARILIPTVCCYFYMHSSKLSLAVEIKCTRSSYYFTIFVKGDIKNDIFGSTIIIYTSLTVNHRKQTRSCLQAIKPRFNRWIWAKISVYYHVCIKHKVFITFTSRSSLKWENQKSAVRKEKLARSSDKGLLLLWLLSFDCHKLQYLLTTVLFFNNVGTLHI